MDIMGTQWQDHKEEELKDKTSQVAFSSIKEFYNVGSNNKTVLWITKHQHCLYWGITEGVSIEKNIYYYRKLKGSWKNHSDEKFFWSDIHGEIAQTYQAQNPIHEISRSTDAVKNYLRNLINGTPKIANSDTISLIQALSPDKFEAFILNIFMLNGYFLTTPVGGTQEGVDFVVSNKENAKEKIAVQIKTKTRKKEFEDYTIVLKHYPKI